MPENIGRQMAALAVSVQSHQRHILDRWMGEQLAADTLRLDLIDESTLRRESEEFLTVLTQGLATNQDADLQQDGWAGVVAFLDDLTEARDESGFSPTETATFVLSLKRPLIRLAMETVETAETGDGVDGVAGDASQDRVWLVERLLDRMALYTTEVYQQRREATIDRQQEEMEELATPVVKVWDGILALPLVGTLDTRRSQMVTESLLEAISSTGSEIAIIDLTGVPTIDTRMAQHLMRTVAATRLMGADCILSGIRPQIAQTIVHLKIDLGNIKTESTLAGALKLAFKESGLRVHRVDA